MNFRRALLTCVVAAVAVAGAVPARAQEPAGPDRCAAQRDSLKEAVRGRGQGLKRLVLFYVAPSALLLRPGFCPGDGEELVFWRDHVSAHVAAGGMASREEVGLMHSMGVEVFALGGYGEVRLDRYHVADSVNVKMWDARVGYLVHPSRGIAGGVTVGWRESPDTPDGWTGGGLLIGFPIMISTCGERSCWLQWEPVYVISGRGLGFTPRLRLNVPLARTPLVARVDVEARGLRKADPLSVSLGLGLRP